MAAATTVPQNRRHGSGRETRLATDRRDAYDAVSRVRHSFERVDEPTGADVDLIVGVLPERSSKVVT